METKHPNNPENLEAIKEEIESLSNEEMAYQLALLFKKSFPKLEMESPINKIISYFIRVCEIKNDDMRDYSEYGDLLIDVSWDRNKEVSEQENFPETIDINNPTFIMLTLMHKLIKSVFKNINNKEAENSNDHNPTVLIEYLTHLNIIYNLYLSSVDLSKKDIENLAEKNTSQDLYKRLDEILG